MPVTGLIFGETLAGIDQRPATGEIVALTSLNRVMRLDPQDGAMTNPGAMGGTFGATASAGWDVNPSADRLRAVNPANDNARFNPVTFTFVQDDTDLAYIATDPNVGVDPNVVAAAYDRNDNNGATASTLFAIDSTLNNLVRQGAIDGNAVDTAGGGSPNGGLLTTLGCARVRPRQQRGLRHCDRDRGRRQRRLPGDAHAGGAELVAAAHHQPPGHRSRRSDHVTGHDRRDHTVEHDGPAGRLGSRGRTLHTRQRGGRAGGRAPRAGWGHARADSAHLRDRGPQRALRARLCGNQRDPELRRGGTFEGHHDPVAR